MDGFGHSRLCVIVVMRTNQGTMKTTDNDVGCKEDSENLHQ